MIKSSSSRRRSSHRSHSHSRSHSRSHGTRKMGGAKMGKELKAWNKHMHKTTGVRPISMATENAAKTKAPPTGSAQREASGQHVAAQSRGMNPA